MVTIVITKKYRKKPVVVEAMTFDEMLKYAIVGPERVVVDRGVPWSFEISGHTVTVSNKSSDIYLISTLEGQMDMTRNDMLIIGVAGEIYPCKKEIFDKTYEVVENE